MQLQKKTAIESSVYFYNLHSILCPSSRKQFSIFQYSILQACDAGWDLADEKYQIPKIFGRRVPRTYSSTNKNKNAPVLAAIILRTVSVKCKKTKKLPWTMRIIPATILSNYCKDEKLKKLSSKKDNFTNYFGLKKLNILSKSPIYEMISIPNLKLQGK